MMKKVVAKFWAIFKKTPLGKLIRILAPQWLVNLVEHLPIAAAANVAYGFPSRKIKVIGVTGTDGKTTTVNMIYQILKAAGKKVSMVSTINAVLGNETLDIGFHVTSPHSFTVQEFIKKAAALGNEYIILEVTSHSLDQHRFLGVRFDIGVVTNITHEHLDYHKTWLSYFNAKAKLIKNVRLAVLNRDEKHFEDLVNKTGGKVVTFGLSKADFTPKKFPFSLLIPGQFNILNGLAAAAVCTDLGIEEKVIKKALAKFKSIPGRMEEIKNNKGIKVIVDFAHTPNGIRSALQSLRQESKGKVIAVFGSAGERDIDKRGQMGEIVARLADAAVVTAEDPRGELEKINEQILKGAKKGGGKLEKNLFVIDNRQQAINFAINSLAKRGDVVGIFGKGHERSINLDGKKELPWSDQAAVKKALV